MLKFPHSKYKIRDANFELDYINILTKVHKKLDIKKLVKLSNLFEKVINGNKRVFVLGNGGSAAVANHYVCDFNKNLSELKNKKKPKFISLTNSIETITAIANDINFNQIYAKQLENFFIKGDLILIMSCSGTSKNIIETLKFCKKKNAKVVFLTGFLKRKIKYKFEIFINLNCENYGICEDIFSTIMHITCQKIKVRNSKKIRII